MFFAPRHFVRRTSACIQCGGWGGDSRRAIGVLSRQLSRESLQRIQRLGGRRTRYGNLFPAFQYIYARGGSLFFGSAFVGCAPKFFGHFIPSRSAIQGYFDAPAPAAEYRISLRPAPEFTLIYYPVTFQLHSLPSLFAVQSGRGCKKKIHIWLAKVALAALGRSFFVCKWIMI